MRRFRSSHHLQRFASVYDQLDILFMRFRYHTDARKKRTLSTQTIEAWERVTHAPILERFAVTVRFPNVLQDRHHPDQ